MFPYIFIPKSCQKGCARCLIGGRDGSRFIRKTKVCEYSPLSIGSCYMMDSENILRQKFRRSYNKKNNTAVKLSKFSICNDLLYRIILDILIHSLLFQVLVIDKCESLKK